MFNNNPNVNKTQKSFGCLLTEVSLTLFLLMIICILCVVSLIIPLHCIALQDPFELNTQITELIFKVILNRW